MIAHGTSGEVGRARTLLEQSTQERLDHHQVSSVTGTPTDVEF